MKSTKELDLLSELNQIIFMLLIWSHLKKKNAVNLKGLFSNFQIVFDERRGSERDYLKRFGKEWKKEGGSTDPAKNKPSQEFVAKHPRYQYFAESK